MFPRERSLAQRYQDQPFVLLGVNSDSSRERLRAVQKKERLTWRSWWDGPPPFFCPADYVQPFDESSLQSRRDGSTGLIARQWAIQALPTTYLLDHRGIPLFTAAAADDQYMNTASQLMKWFSDLTGNPRNQFVGFPNGRHGTEIFGPHPELVHKIVAFYLDTLVTSPVPTSSQSSTRDTPEQKFWLLASKPGGAGEAAAMFHEARKRDPNAYLFPESLVNLLGYTRLQAGEKDESIQLFQLNTEAYPASANAQDSLSDGYLAADHKDLALAAEEKCLALLPADPSDPRFKAELRQHAEEKVTDLRSNKNNK